MQFLKAQNTDGNTALHVAAKRGFDKIVRVLVEKERDLPCVKNKAEETALFKASENGHVRIVEYLLDYTPESDELDTRNDGQTSLHGAVSELHTGVTEKLLERRPGLVHIADAFQRTPLHILALVPLVNPLSLWRRSISYIIIPKIVRMLLDKDISLIYRVDANSQSPLHLGAKVGYAPFVKAILRYRTDCTHILDKDCRTALHLAVENASLIYQRVGRNYLKTIISSLTLTELMDCSDNKGQTALDISIEKTHEDQQLFSGLSNVLISI